MKKRILVTLLAFLLLLASVPSLAEDITLDCIHWKPEATDGLEAMAEAFRQTHPNVSIEFSGAGTYKETLVGRLAAGNAPDLITTPGGNYGFDIPKGGYMVDLSNWEGLSKLKPELVEAQRYNGKIYSIPIDVAAHGVLYNKKIFADLGLQVPKTWSEFETVCQKIKDSGITPMLITGKDAWTLGIVGTTLAAPIYGKNPEFDMDVINGKESYVNDDWRKMMSYYETIKSKYANSDISSLDYSLGNQMIANGEACMLIQGIWAVSAIKEYNPDIDLGIFVMPTAEKAEDNCLIWGPDFTIGISTTTPYQKECYEFLDFMTSKEGADIWTSKVKTFSAVKDSDMEFDPIASDINNILSTGIKTYPLVNHMWFMDNVWIDWANSIQSYNNGTASVDDTLNVLEKAVKEAYAIYSK